MKLKVMGVMNVTPNSFSDPSETFTSDTLSNRLEFLKNFDAIDIGCESTAPMNHSIPWGNEWERWQMVLPFLKNVRGVISADTYHPETIFELVKYWEDHKLPSTLMWNDVSGKFDESVKDFLKTGRDYVFCHNLSPRRELSGRHMEYVNPQMDLVAYFHSYRHPQVIFDPCLGFSKTFEQNWEILSGFSDLQKKLNHTRWLVGFSRKSFLKKKYGVEERDKLDELHVQEIKKLLHTAVGELWVRTHRPELIQN